MQPSSENCIVHESRSNELGNKLLCTPEKFVEQRNANLLKVTHFSSSFSILYFVSLYALQEIDMSRARIRSLSLYSPVETVLQKAISAYLYSTIR